MSKATRVYPFEDPALAAEAGRRGGQARARRYSTLTVQTAERELPPMDSVENIRKRLEIVSIWASGGLLSAGVAHALVRAAQTGLRAIEAQQTGQVLDKLERRLVDLEAQAKGRTR